MQHDDRDERGVCVKHNPANCREYIHHGHDRGVPRDYDVNRLEVSYV